MGQSAIGAGETKPVTLDIEPLLLSVFNTDKDDWELLPGDYKVYVGGSSDSTPLQATVHISASR